MREVLVLTISADRDGLEVRTDHPADPLGLRTYEWCQPADLAAVVAEIVDRFLRDRGEVDL